MSKGELKIQKYIVWNCRRCYLLGPLFPKNLGRV